MAAERVAELPRRLAASQPLCLRNTAKPRAGCAQGGVQVVPGKDIVHLKKCRQIQQIQQCAAGLWVGKLRAVGVKQGLKFRVVQLQKVAARHVDA